MSITSFLKFVLFSNSVQVWQLSVLHHFLSSLNTKHAHNIMPLSWHWVQSCKLLLFVVLERWSGIPFQVVEAVLLIAVTLLLVVQMPQAINLLYWDLRWTGYPSHHLRCRFLHQQMHRDSWILRLFMSLVKIKFRLNFFNLVDSQFPLSPSPNSWIIRDRRINLN